MLQEKDFFKGIVDREQITIDRIKQYDPTKNGQECYYLAFSGGKDSIVVKHLMKRANVNYETHYNVTTIDPPELIYYIKNNHKDVVFDYPEKPFLQRLVEKGFPPTRRGRWCCAEYKENGGQNRMVVTGIRRAESVRRSNRKYIDTCLNHKFLHPILEWTENDIWEYIYKHNLPYCRLYDEGWTRIGCLFCPMRPYSKKKQEAEKYPKFYQAFIRAFKKMYDKRANGKNPIQNWKNGEEMFMWWIRGKGTGHPDQTVMFE